MSERPTAEAAGQQARILAQALAVQHSRLSAAPVQARAIRSTAASIPATW